MSADWLLPILVLIITCSPFVSFFLYRKHSYSVASISAFYFIVACYSLVGFFPFSFSSDVPWGFYDDIESKHVLFASVVYLGIACSMAVGAVFDVFLVRRNLNTKIHDARLSLRRLTSKFQLPIIVIVFVPIVFLTLGYEFSQLIFREGYDVDGWHLGVLIARVMLPISALFVAFVRLKYLRWFLFSVLYLCFFSITSRAIILVPAFYFVGSYFISGRIGFFRLTSCVGLAVLGATMALDYRLNEYQGLVPNISAMLSGDFTLSSMVKSLNYVFSYSVGYLGYMIKYVEYDSTLFWLAVNPLPGSFINIQFIIDHARIAPRIPYSAIGEMYLFLGHFIYIVFFAMGFVISSMERRLMSKSMGVALIFIVFIVIMGVMSTQYNLRGAMRLFYYAVFVFFLFEAVRCFMLVFRRKNFINGGAYGQ